MKPRFERLCAKAANEITDELFRFHVGATYEKAQRLVLELDKKLNGPGWSKKAMTDVILKHLLKD